jgi:hypothetical protein
MTTSAGNVAFTLPSSLGADLLRQYDTPERRATGNLTPDQIRRANLLRGGMTLIEQNSGSLSR